MMAVTMTMAQSGESFFQAGAEVAGGVAAAGAVQAGDQADTLDLDGVGVGNVDDVADGQDLVEHILFLFQVRYRQVLQEAAGDAAAQEQEQAAAVRQTDCRFTKHRNRPRRE
jgi:hypothetical protein